MPGISFRARPRSLATVAGLAGHAFKDLWQHRHQFVANTRWWPPFCLVVDWTVATIIAVALLAGVQFHNYAGLGQ
jgi:hypothetical protein